MLGHPPEVFEWERPGLFGLGPISVFIRHIRQGDAKVGAMEQQGERSEKKMEVGDVRTIAAV